MMKPSRATQKPAWGVLYAKLGGVVALWIIAMRATSKSGWDRWMDLVFLVLVFGVMWLWVRANRAALAQSDQHLVQGRSRVGQIIALPHSEVMPRTGGNGSALSKTISLIDRQESDKYG